MKRLFYCLFALLALVSCKDDDDKYPGMKPFYGPDCEVFRDIVRNCGGEINIGEGFTDVSDINLYWPESWKNVSWVYVPELGKNRIKAIKIFVPNDTTHQAYIPKSITKLDSLKDLWIIGKAYRGTLPDGLGKLPLTTIRLEHCNFDELPEDLFTDRLTKMEIYDLPIRKIPESIVNLRSFLNKYENEPESPNYPKFMIVKCENLTGAAPSTPYARVCFTGNNFLEVDFNSVLFDTVFDPQGRACYRWQTFNDNKLFGFIPDSIVKDKEKLVELITVRTQYQKDEVLGFANIPQWFFMEYPGWPWRRE